MIRDLIRSYRKVEPFVFHLTYAQFCVQLINAAFFILLNFYFLEYNYKDYEIANFIAWRYAAVALLSIPLGFLLRGKKLISIMRYGAFFFPLVSLCIIFSIPLKIVWLIKLLMALYSITFLFLHITSLPFIMQNCKDSTRSEAISMMFQVWGLAVMSIGFLSYFLKKIDASIFSDYHLLIGICLFGWMALYFLSKITIVETTKSQPWSMAMLKEYDWKLIWKATMSVQLIAVGAGFTIPFFSLYFNKVFNFTTDQFSILTGISHLIVAMAMFITPWIRKEFGYKKGIIVLQSAAVLCLLIFLSTEWYSQWWLAVYVAVAFYIIRQPLMNSAAPLTSELSLDYVGNKNREMISAIDAGIWNSGWLFSAIIFEFLRRNHIAYSYIFLITAVMYVFGIIANYYIIGEVEKQEKNKKDAQSS